MVSRWSSTDKVFVTHRLPQAGLEVLAGHCAVEVWPGPGLLPADQLLRRVPDCRGLICLLTDRIDARLLAQAPALEFVSTMSVGVDHIDLRAASERGIAVGNTPGVLVDTTADLAFGLLLAAARRLTEADRFVREACWRQDNAWAPDFFTGVDVSGATLGIVGLGAIGQAVARRAAGFGMNILGWNRTERDVLGVDCVGLEELLARSDFVSIHVALGTGTHHLLNAQKIAVMKPGAVLVNTARGGIVDEVALAAALDSGQVYAAGIDVFEREPVARDNPLLVHPRVVVAPHIGSATVKTRAKMATMAVDNALAAVRGEAMTHCANPQVYQSGSGSG